jgi:hypothetical protein
VRKLRWSPASSAAGRTVHATSRRYLHLTTRSSGRVRGGERNHADLPGSGLCHRHRDWSPTTLMAMIGIVVGIGGADCTAEMAPRLEAIERSAHRQ